MNKLKLESQKSSTAKTMKDTSKERQNQDANDLKDSEDRDASIAMSLMQFADSTTAHGFSRLAGSSGRTGSGLWLLFLLAAYAGLCYHTATLITKYKSHPVSTSLLSDIPFQYPDIYLCSANPVGYSRITRSIQNTAEYASLYETNLTAYKTKMQQEVQSNAAAQVSVEIRDAWKKWQSIILSIGVNNSFGRLNACRISLQGLEFSGSYNFALTYGKNLQPIRVPCLTWSAARLMVRNFSAAIADLVPNVSNALCQHVDNYLNISETKAVLGASTNDNTYIIGSVLQGPYCFHRSNETSSGLDVNYCGVQFCNNSNNSLASCSSQESVINTTYMGDVQTSRSGRRCESWEALVNGSLSKRFRNLNASYEFQVFLPDPESIASVGSRCRSAAVMYKDLKKPYLGWRPITKLIIDGQVDKMPWCFVEKAGYNNLTMEGCTVPDCSSSLKCISGLLHQKYGPQVLSKLVGPSLDANLLDCTFGSQKCTAADFTGLHHPYYGACYKFNSEPFLRNLKPMQQGLRPLSLKLFADDHDYLGYRRPDTFTAVRAVMGGPYNLGKDSDPAGFNLFIMPQQFFPSTSHAIPIYTGARSTIRMRFVEDSDESTRGFCIPDKTSMNYSIYSWNPTVLRPRAEQSINNWDPYFSQFTDSRFAFRTNQESCANLAVIDEFVRRCGCLPYLLPIPTKYSEVIDCFHYNDSDPNRDQELLQREACAMTLYDRFETLMETFWSDCKPNCRNPTYSVTMTSQPWPDASNAVYKATLQSLTSLIGFPKRVSPDLGLTMLYYSYLDQLVRPNSTESFGQSLAMREAARSNLAWIRVEAESPIGSGSVQEDGYTLANLMAEMGGILGLYCGVSVLTICELMDLVGRLVHRAALRSVRNRGKVGSSTDKLKQAWPGSL